jgi:hypothetical protein
MASISVADAVSVSRVGVERPDRAGRRPLHDGTLNTDSDGRTTDSRPVTVEVDAEIGGQAMRMRNRSLRSRHATGRCVAIVSLVAAFCLGGGLVVQGSAAAASRFSPLSSTRPSDAPAWSNRLFGAQPFDSEFTLAPSGVGADAVTAAAVTSQFSPLVPARLLDTRAPFDPLVGVKRAGTEFTLPVAGRGGVSVGATAVVLNVTVDGPLAPGFVTVWPCGSVRPNASALNFAAGETRANASFAKLGSNGAVCLFVSATTNVVVDVTGYFSVSSGFTSLTPARLTDTRPGAATIDGKGTGGGPIRDVVVQVAERGGVPPGASAVALNVTVDAPTGAGFVTVYPCSESIPTASILNFVAGQTAAAAAVIKLDSDGRVCVFSNVFTDVVVDVTGWFSLESVSAVTPSRLVDTRMATSQAPGRKSAGTTFRVQVTGSSVGPVPDGSGAAILAVTAVDPGGDGFVTVWPCGNRPNASAVNYRASQNTANLAVIALDAAGGMCVFVLRDTDIVIDVTGFYAAGTTDPIPTSPSPPIPKIPKVPSVVQTIYAVPSDEQTYPLEAGIIGQEASEVQLWYDGQTGGRHPRLARDGAAVSVITVVLPFTKAELKVLTSSMDLIASAIHKAVPATVDQALLIELLATTSDPYCGVTSGTTILIPMGNCAKYPGFDYPAPFPYGTTYVVAHELTHLLGAVPNCAAHATGDGHVDDDVLDIVYGGNLPRNLSMSFQLDAGHDDYFMTGRTDCTDIANSPLLDSTPYPAPPPGTLPYAYVSADAICQVGGTSLTFRLNFAAAPGWTIETASVQPPYVVGHWPGDTRWTVREYITANCATYSSPTSTVVTINGTAYEIVHGSVPISIWCELNVPCPT